jgi:octaprenyl-diphosphate synthase
VEGLFDNPNPGDEAVADVIAIVAANGGLDFARARGERFAREAEEALTGLPESPVKSALYGAIGYVMERRS